MARRSVLTINAGSSSLRVSLQKIAADGEPEPTLRGHIGALGTGSDTAWNCDSETAGPRANGAQDHASALAALREWLVERGWLADVGAVAHRIVHGGTRGAPVQVDALLLEELQNLSALAPLHQPQGLAALRAMRELLPAVPQIACFDTSFHQTMPERAWRLPLPDLGLPQLRRYGFHGLSFESIARRLPDKAPAARRVVIAHLGSGASLCALNDGSSIATTMGMTPLDGVPMATRSGAVDPGAVLWLLSQPGYTPERVTDLLYRESGLRGISGLSGDMVTLLASDDPRAAMAVDLFCLRCAQALAALTVELGGLDALVFTGGIGERAAAVRAAIVDLARPLGLRLDPDANGQHAECISAVAEPASIWVLPADEEDALARHAARWLQDGGNGA